MGEKQWQYKKDLTREKLISFLNTREITPNNVQIFSQQGTVLWTIFILRKEKCFGGSDYANFDD